MRIYVFLLISFVVILAEGRCVGAGSGVLKFTCASDASAAVSVGVDMFVVADDENNVLKFYKTSGSSEPVSVFNLNSFLGIDPKHPEADIEGATKIADRIYWITSHGRNKDGKPRASRYNFFATDIVKQGDDVVLKPVGNAYFDLAHKIVKDEKLKSLGLEKATRFYDLNLSKKQRKVLAPKRDGLNIEGLCGSADGQSIYIGLRNPQYGKSAIVIQLLNPVEVIDKMASPVFGEPILWDLKGRGVRSFEYNPYHKAYFIIAGPVDSESVFGLYKWSGKRGDSPEVLGQVFAAKFTPEALVVFDGKAEMLVLSDDGTIDVKVDSPAECMEGEYDAARGTCKNKHLIIPQKQSFSAIWVGH